ncbi:hypothetical protein LTR37_004374 [Vermiconidia calcicola]|uniref:Uncharacterized protein n=1 Tax=Vermiconidia calcicola TaxID=1690605 RepID=A0ACC3NP43_9PEZI|nr:hypothetical protein LTR37_004374 [Vermiconidia calcicola]
MPPFTTKGQRENMAYPPPPPPPSLASPGYGSPHGYGSPDAPGSYSHAPGPPQGYGAPHAPGPPPHDPGYPQHVPHGQPAQAQPTALQYRTLEPVPPGTRVMSRTRPDLEYQPNDGPLGFGVYLESAESPHIINFRPVSQATRVQSSNQAERVYQPSPFPFPAPPRTSTPPPPDLIDPNWIEWWKDTSKIDGKGLAPWAQRSMLEDRVLPMLEYISSVQGPHAEMYKQDLMKRAEDLGHRKDEGERHDEKWFASRRGMLGGEYDKAVIYGDPLTDWRK